MGTYRSTYLQAFKELLERAQSEVNFLESIFAQRVKEDRVLTAKDCIPNSKDEDYKGKLLILDPHILKPMFKASEHQVVSAYNGFGCSPAARGRKVYTKALIDGYEGVYQRQDFLGVLDPEHYPDWVKDKLSAQETQNQAESEDEDEMEV
jgi:hypothetical protein